MLLEIILLINIIKATWPFLVEPAPQLFPVYHISHLVEHSQIFLLSLRMNQPLLVIGLQLQLYEVLLSFLFMVSAFLLNLARLVAEFIHA